jgi:hypothetical protein
MIRRLLSTHLSNSFGLNLVTVRRTGVRYCGKRVLSWLQCIQSPTWVGDAHKGAGSNEVNEGQEENDAHCRKVVLNACDGQGQENHRRLILQ